MTECAICKRPMTIEPSLHQDCGGDCLLCMAEVGDDDAAFALVPMIRRISDAIHEIRRLEQMIRDIDGSWL